MGEHKRLLDTFKPEHYDVYLDISRADKTIKGTTTITGEAVQSPISINQKYLMIDDVTVNDQVVPFDVSEKDEVLNVQAPQGKVTVKIDYHAKLTDTMMGIYPSYYQVDGQKKQLVGTQFETTAARQAFPCVDEPAAKATFSLAIKFDEHKGETVIANTPEDHVKDGVHYFKQTVRMSTYLVAFAFGEMQSKITHTKSGVEVGVFSTKAHQPKELDFALDIAKRCIEFYEDFYQTPYPLDHSYQLALPDFSAGAMENWGLITYREAYLTVDPDNTTLENKQLVATVITHELAHQWFGDLVTMKWWDDLWLNESFANMMEYVAVDALEPDWHIWEMFQTSEAPMALQRDATDGVQPVHVDVNDPAEIDSIFDAAIVYAKGSRMLVMVRSLLGDDALRKGLKNYFAAHKYSNAAGDDLWKALGDASGMDIGAIMHSWLEQPGYPVVSATVEDGQLLLRQQQFFIGEHKDAGRTWQIPLNANYDGLPEIMKDSEIKVGDYSKLREQAGKPLIINDGNNSHFIVKYDDQLMKDILDHLDALSPIDQLAILQDARLLAQGQQRSYAELVPLIMRFANSHSAVVNNALYRIANYLKNFVTPGETEDQLRKLFGKLSHEQMQRLGWESQEGESNDDQLTRPYILSAALYAKDEDAIQAAHRLFEAFQDKPADLAADVRLFVLRNEVQNYGSGVLFDHLLNDYVQTSDPSYKEDICAALTSTPDDQLLAKLVDKFEDAATIKPQDLRAWYRGVLANQKGQQRAWDWLRDQWDWLDKTVGGDMEFATYITVTAGIFHTTKRLNEFKDFFNPKINTPGLTREIKMDTNIIAGKASLVEDEGKAVNEAIAKEL
ncbi:M1 family metallopeptidase [Limosilactobacillus sp.]|uniref:M1 family metallopeptidase n=1 Tax=Limosilactobacillus sp. TaxID=2773925 RepID=UPI00345E58DB